MKKLMPISILAAWCGLQAFADEPSAVSKNTSPADSSETYAGKLGVGIVIGEPTGGSIKYWLNDTLAVDGAVGWSSHDNTDLYAHSDLLWHNFDLFPVARGRLPVYIGVCGLMRFRDDHNDNQVGIRSREDVAFLRV